MSEPITESWLRSAGFKWEDIPRGGRQWLLWLGWAIPDTTPEDLGVELAYDQGGDFWRCWIRADYAGRYSRFLHVRHMRQVDELVKLIEALAGIPFVKEDCMYGCMRTGSQAIRLRHENEQLHMRMAHSFGRAYASDAKVENDEAKRGLINDRTKG